MHRAILVFAAALLLASVCARASDAPRYEPLRLNGWQVRWFPNEIGKVWVTYAVADRDVVTPEAVNCRSMRSPGSVLRSANITRERFRALLRAAFDSWERAADIVFIEAADPANANVLIGEQTEPAGHAFTSVLPGPRTSEGYREISKAAICFNPERSWKDGRGGEIAAFDLTYTLKHEIGHVIGLDHPSRRGQLMSFRYSEDLLDLAAGDVAGAASVYGSPPAPRALFTPASIKPNAVR